MMSLPVISAKVIKISTKQVSLSNRRVIFTYSTLTLGVLRIVFTKHFLAACVINFPSLYFLFPEVCLKNYY